MKLKKSKLAIMALTWAAMNAHALPEFSVQNQLLAMNGQIKQLKDAVNHLKAENQALKQWQMQAKQATPYDAMPVGAIVAFAYYQDLPEGWMACEGQTLDPNEFGSLYDKIHYIYGMDDGWLFRLPDLRGEFIRGWSNQRAGVDANRPFGQWQKASHVTHNDGSNTLVGVPTPQRDLLGYEPAAGSFDFQAIYTGAGAHGPLPSTKYLSTIRPRNLALLYAIKAFQPDALNKQDHED